MVILKAVLLLIYVIFNLHLVIIDTQMEKTFLVYCRHVSFVTKGGFILYVRGGERSFGEGGHSKIGREIFFGGGGHAKNFSDFRKTTAPPPPTRKK